MKPWSSATALAFAAALTGCSENTTGTVSLSLSSLPPPAPLAALRADAPALSAISTAGDSTLITMGNDTIILRSVELVLRKVELKKVETSACDDVPDNGDCEEFETGAMLAALPLGATAATTEIAVNAPPGLYDKLEFEIHKVDPSADAVFLAAHPGFDGISIKVTGTYSQAGTRSDFTYTTALDASQEAVLNPPLTVVSGTAANLTLRFDVSSWYLNAGKTALVNPATANTGGANESIVNDNIKQSFEAFKDDNHDGRDDVNEGS
jgi:hypothetical protein